MRSFAPFRTNSTKFSFMADVSASTDEGLKDKDLGGRREPDQNGSPSSSRLSSGCFLSNAFGSIW